MKWNKIFRRNIPHKGPTISAEMYVRIQLTEKEADYLGRLLSSENVSIKGLEDIHEIKINKHFANAIRDTVVDDLRTGNYFDEKYEPIDKEKVDIVESLIDKFFC